MAVSPEQQPPWVAELMEQDWAEFDHAYGPATDVPDQIVAIAFGEQPAATAALDALCEQINHQDTCYPATGPAVPFLVHALDAQTAPTIKAGLLNLLGGIVGGVGLCVEDIPEELLGDEDDDYEGVSYRAIAEHVWNGAEVYAELVSHEDVDVRTQAAHLLGRLAQLGPFFVPNDLEGALDTTIAALLNRVDVETDDLTRASVALALGQFVAYDARARDPIRRMLDQPGELTPIMAALALVQADAQQREEGAAAERLVRAVQHSDEIDHLLRSQVRDDGHPRSFPWIWGRLRFQLCHSLCAWSIGDEQRMETVLPALVCCVRAANGYTVEEDVSPVLRWLWPDRRIELQIANGEAVVKHPELLTSKDMTGIRRTVVEACYENKQIWNMLIGNAALAFTEVGLPTSRNRIRRLLKKSWWDGWVAARN